MYVVCVCCVCMFVHVCCFACEESVELLRFWPMYVCVVCGVCCVYVCVYVCIPVCACVCVCVCMYLCVCSVVRVQCAVYRVVCGVCAVLCGAYAELYLRMCTRITSLIKL